MSFKATHPNQTRDNRHLSQMSERDIIKKLKKGSVSFTSQFRQALWKAHDQKCAYCGIDLECCSDMRIDHFIPKSYVMDNSIDNLVASCKRCNSIKGKNNLDYFRFSMAVSNSILCGIVLPNIAKKLIDIGIELPIKEKPFYFEILSGVKYE